MDGVAGDWRALHVEVPQLERHEIARQHVAPACAEFEIAHAAKQLAEEASRARWLHLNRQARHGVRGSPALQCSFLTPL